jgi:hypothetical protein
VLDPQMKSTGRRYTATAALLSIALLFSPAALIVSRQFGYVSLSLAVVSSALCLALAWIDWTRSSQLSILSIVPQNQKP